MGTCLGWAGLRRRGKHVCIYIHLLTEKPSKSARSRTGLSSSIVTDDDRKERERETYMMRGLEWRSAGRGFLVFIDPTYLPECSVVESVDDDDERVIRASREDAGEDDRHGTVFHFMMVDG